MSYKMITISVLVSVLVLFKSENRARAGDEDEKQLAGVLTGILSNPGWREISHVQVKHTENLVFVGKHLPGDPRENVGSKYLTTVHLLGCVYVNVLFEYCHSFANVLLLNTKERHKSRMRAQRSLKLSKGHEKDGKNNLDDDDDDDSSDRRNVEGQSAVEEPQKKRSKVKNPNYELYKKSINYDVSSEYISVAVRMLQNSYQMFDYMGCVLRYLLEEIPKLVGIRFGSYFEHLEKIQCAVENFFELSIELLKTVPENGDDFAKKASNLLSRAVNGMLNNNVGPYLGKYCIIEPELTIVDPDFTTLTGTSGDCHQVEPQSNIAKDSEKQIETLVQVFKNSYFTKLGFVYGKTKHNFGYVRHQVYNLK